MANELAISGVPTGRTLYTVVRNRTQQPYNTSSAAWETATGANWAAYAVALTEQIASGYYVGSLPAAITTRDLYSYEVRQQAGGSPTVTDASLGALALPWTGALEAMAPVENAAGQADIDMTETVPASPVVGSIGESLEAATVEGEGKWIYTPPTVLPGAGSIALYDTRGNLLHTLVTTTNAAGVITQRA